MEVDFVPPMDSEDDYYLLNCFVCEEVAKPGQSHMRNYGGTVCFSCRQFFRRLHQGNRQPDFSCKNQDNCHITVFNRRKCQKCRYNRCVLAGMCPMAVLNEDQKKVRFQRILRKKGVLSSTSQIMSQHKIVQQQNEPMNLKRYSSESIETLSGKMPKLIPIPRLVPIPVQQNQQQQRMDESQMPIERKMEKINQQQKQQRHQQQQLQQLQQQHHQQQQLHQPKNNKLQQLEQKMDPIKQESNQEGAIKLIISKGKIVSKEKIEIEPEVESPVWPDFLHSKVEFLLQSLEKSGAQIDQILLRKLLEIKQGDSSVSIKTRDVLNFVSQHSKQFLQFASMQNQFLRLNPEEQTKLLSSNTPLYAQLCLFIHFYDIFNPQLISQMFGSDCNIELYFRLMKNLSSLYRKCPKVRAVLAYVLLFDCTKGSNLWDNLVLDDMHILNSMMFQICRSNRSGEISLQEFYRTLKSMTQFCSINLKWREEKSSEGLLTEIAMPYSFEEDHWLKSQLEKTQENLWSVPIGEDVLRELLLFSIGVVPSRFYLLSTCHVFAERIWKVLEMHQEFSKLPSNQKPEMVEMKLPAALALLLARQEVLPTGVKQCQDIFGEYQDMEIQDHCQKVMSHPAKMKRVWLEKSCINILSSEVKKVTLSDVAQFESDPKIFNSLKVVSEMTKRFQTLLADPTSFKMLLLLLLTFPTKHSGESEFTRLHDIYLKTFLRRTNWIFGRKDLTNKIVKNLFEAARHFQIISESTKMLLTCK